jgi:4-hydroxy-3-methylbut-2-enyl diphosphate reductase
VLVIGSKNSSNSNRLKDMAEESGAKAVLIDAPEDINRQVLDEAGIIGITAGASAPEVLVENVINFIIGHYGAEVEILDGPVENVQFKLPASLKA